MAKDWTDAEFEVVWAPPRRGDPHPNAPRWRYVGLDPTGRAVWRRKPLLNRVQTFLALCAAAPVLSLVVYLVAEALHHWRA